MDCPKCGSANVVTTFDQSGLVCRNVEFHGKPFFCLVTLTEDSKEIEEEKMGTKEEIWICPDCEEELGDVPVTACPHCGLELDYELIDQETLIDYDNQ